MTDESQAHELKHECMKPNRWFFQLIVQIETTNRLLRSTDVIQSSATPTNTSISSVLVCNAANVSLLHWLRVPERIMYMSQRPSTIVSVWTTPASRWPWVKAEAAIVINFSTGCSVHVTIHDRRPRTWNSLPDSLHRLSSLEQFKKLLKTHLFKISFVQQDSLRRLVLFTALYKLSTLDYITLHVAVSIT